MDKRSGFTIIEIALVLGIAGLIFIMAFIALPSLWASQRDADRKAKVMEFISDLKTYQTNNSRGALPTLSGNGPEIFTWNEAQNNPNSAWRTFVNDYVKKEFEDPSGDKYTFYVVKCLADSGGDLSVSAPCEYNSANQTNAEGKNIQNFKIANDVNNANLDTNINDPEAAKVLYITIAATCDGDHAVRSSNNRNVAVVQLLERAGRYCYNT